jgi:hypothetical protein
MKEKKSLVPTLKWNKTGGQNIYAGLCNFNEGTGFACITEMCRREFESIYLG